MPHRNEAKASETETRGRNRFQIPSIERSPSLPWPPSSLLPPSVTGNNTYAKRSWKSQADESLGSSKEPRSL